MRFCCRPADNSQHIQRRTHTDNIWSNHLFGQVCLGAFHSIVDRLASLLTVPAHLSQKYQYLSQPITFFLKGATAICVEAEKAAHK